MINFTLSTTLETEKALIDSGATENFIDPRTVSRMKIPTKKLDRNRTIHNINGTTNSAGNITRKCTLNIQVRRQTKEQEFFITNLGQDRVVLGYPFLQNFNPQIDWDKGELHRAKQVKATPKQIWEHCWRLWRTGRTSQIRKTTFAQKWAAIADKTKEKLKNLPKEYQEHRKVFSEEEAEWLPPHQVEDMEINFKEGAPMELDCRTYPLSDKERKVLCDELNKDIAKGFIKHGTSSYISLVFFVPKKDGEELWMVINYRKLNDITKKDFYPLPDLRWELEKLSKHSLFSKFDVWAGYNNIRIADKDQYKVAFKPPFGTFIPTVMTFGFCNAPSIF